MRCPGVMASLHDAWRAVARSFGGTAASAAAAAALAAERGGRRWPARLGLEASLPLPVDSCWGALLRLGMDPRFLLGLVIGWKVVAEVGALGAVLLASLFKMAVGCAAGYCRRVPKGRCCTATGQPPAAQQRVSSASKVPRLAPHSALQLLKGRRPSPAPPNKVRVHTMAARSPPPPSVLPPPLPLGAVPTAAHALPARTRHCWQVSGTACGVLQVWRPHSRLPRTVTGWALCCAALC